MASSSLFWSLLFTPWMNSFLSPLGFSANEIPGINIQASEQRITNSDFQLK